MHRTAWVAALVVLAGIVPDAQVVRYIDGIFVAPREGAPVELIAYAEQTSAGRLRMTEGTLDDVPVIHEAVSVLTSLPHWTPVGAFVTTTALFKDERAERRALPFAVVKLNVYALSLRIADLERRDRIDGLLRAVRASYETPGYAFIVMANDGYIRHYPLRLTPLEP
jgi:hypothetical protein